MGSTAAAHPPPPFFFFSFSTVDVIYGGSFNDTTKIVGNQLQGYSPIHNEQHVCWCVGMGTRPKVVSSRWRHNGRDSVSNHQPHDCLLNRLFGRRSNRTSKLRVTGLSAGNSPGTGEFPAQMASTAENVSIWWRHHAAKPTQVMEVCRSQG